jgi:predicted Rdx family selenoprotein
MTKGEFQKAISGQPIAKVRAAMGALTGMNWDQMTKGQMLFEIGRPSCFPEVKRLTYQQLRDAIRAAN